MSGFSGLGSLEVAALQAIADSGGAPHASFVPTSKALAALDDRHGLGPRHGYPLLADLGLPWRITLPLLDLEGNWGSQHGDPAADARYTEVRLSAWGRLALDAENGRVGAVPLGIVNGTLYRGGDRPPYPPEGVLSWLRLRSPDPFRELLPELPTGCAVSGELAALEDGRLARISLESRIAAEPGRLVIGAVPYGIAVDTLMEHLDRRVSGVLRRHREPGRYRDYLPPGEDAGPPPEPLIADVHDESRRGGVRILLPLVPGADPATALEWVRSVWPVTVETDWRLPAPLGRWLDGWHGGDGSGLAAMAALLG